MQNKYFNPEQGWNPRPILTDQIPGCEFNAVEYREHVKLGSKTPEINTQPSFDPGSVSDEPVHQTKVSTLKDGESKTYPRSDWLPDLEEGPTVHEDVLVRVILAINE